MPGRAITIGAILSLLAGACQATSSSANLTAAPPIVGLFQSEGPVGTGAVGSKTCVGIRLDDAAYRTGTLDVSWWLVGPAGCHTSSSGLTTLQGRLVRATIPGADSSSARPGYHVEIDVPLIPTGIETIVFTIDSQGAVPGHGISAYPGPAVSGSAVVLDPVLALDVHGPGESPPTPGTP